MRAVVDNVAWLGRCQDLVHSAGAILSGLLYLLELLVQLTQDGLAASDFVEVGTDALDVSFIHDLSDHAIDVEPGGEESVQLV